MRYHYEIPENYVSSYGAVYTCDHPLYKRCTLFKIDKLGLGVIQQRFDECTKQTYWTEIDPWLTDEIYLHPCFQEVFREYAGPREDGIYPTVSVRHLMWRLRLKPLPKERWETVFDRTVI